MLYTCSTNVPKKTLEKMKQYYIIHGYGNDEVVPEKSDLNLYKKGIITAKGFAINYEVKLRSQEAYDWMERVSREASHEDVVLIGEQEGTEKGYLAMLVQMMVSMFAGKIKFQYLGELP
jgi:hypothetical protein